MTSYNIILSTVYDTKKQKDQLWLLMASSGSVKGLFKHQLLKEPKLAQLDKMYSGLQQCVVKETL
jgi:hypothetical protein